ncbi:hypothetical protein BSY238_106 [Methyloversatilis sp. RAC08]|uniref:DUF5681 domain-containing protein n=1 Tax=Methyloversatilis sp. RAC08 TaxID=1842540 RepID=UPI00083CC296|nr:DUF5681 domain-containing protein [Methyloversatilis sp. RAC08]AOF82456.1 hypothetical protein BSY238_106 [Methyloversatilis sp. RAC08]
MTQRRRAPPKAWKPGESGNLAGKPKGTRNKATRMVLALMEGGAETITKKVVELAEAGDLAAARLVIERLAPPVRERPISLDLPDTATAEGVSKAQQIVLEAVGSGDLFPGEGQTLAGILETRRKALETEELERRITALEAQR